MLDNKFINHSIKDNVKSYVKLVHNVQHSKSAINLFMQITASIIIKDITWEWDQAKDFLIQIIHIQPKIWTSDRHTKPDCRAQSRTQSKKEKR